MADFINTFDKTRLVKVIALYEWICHVNNKPSLRYPAFNDPAENAIAYTAPNDDFLTQASMKSLQLEHNAPNLADFMDLMLFIEAVNSEDAEFPELSENDKEFYEVYAKQPNKSLFQVFYKPTNVEPAEIKANDRHPLANGMLMPLSHCSRCFINQQPLSLPR